ncbi:beta/gamma crystallin domain-containing protein [Kitasatospora sp. NPDC051914]|uniref:beta/gamma crystallin domain-containing protein n=1 Tax=Kitasatospora sp. NPDC051914 TaxID=3154945 RepID=UPI0034194D39
MTRRWKQAALTPAAAAVLALALPATDASAINRVNCAGRTDFVNIYNYGWSGHLCFANAGYADVTIYNVDNIYSGNNLLYYYTSINGGVTRHLDPWTWEDDRYYDNGAQGTVRWLQIF